MRTKTKQMLLSLALAVCMLAAAWTGLAHGGTVHALDASSTVPYPFETGEKAFQYAPTVAEPSTESKDSWEYMEVLFDKETEDVSAADYVAVQVRVDKGNPGLTIGLIENGDRFFIAAGAAGDTSPDRNPVYFQSEDGTLREIKIQYNAVNLGEKACGTLYLPLSSMVWQWNNNGSDLTKVKAFYMTANMLYNRDYEVTFGEIGMYKGEPGAEDTVFTKLVDLSKGERAKSKYYIGSANLTISFPSDSALPKIPYAFASAETAYNHTVTWTPTEKGQTLTVATDEAGVDLSQATHVLIQYQSTTAPRLQFALSDGSKTSAVKSGARTFFVAQGANVGNLINVANASGIAVNNGRYLMGMVVLPVESLASGVDLSAVQSVVLTSTGAAKVVIGGVAAYRGERGDGSYAGGESTTLLDLSTSKIGKFTASAADTLTENTGKPSRVMNGTVTMDVNCEGKTAEDYPIWTGGSFGEVKMTTDTYGNTAVKMQAKDNNPEGDPYTAITIADGIGVDWAGLAGVTFWARNDSDAEVSFNLEVDCKTPVLSKDYWQVASDRFNIQQGHRFFLYDVNTGKTTIYMTRPTATLPVGFEGWVFIPFTAFERAEWSNNGVTKDLFMNENSIVTYLAVTVHAATYTEKAFSLNQFGGYAIAPSFESTYVDAGDRSIPDLLGLKKED